jgi:8-oxo-dGTP diphosphatase
MSERILNVAAGVILRADGKVLLGRRPEGKSWAGWWELPGGKLEPGETVLQALIRELDEELGIHVTEAYPWVTYVHAYPHTTVRLAFCQVTGWQGEPEGREKQQLQWIDPNHANEIGDVLPATLPPLRWLRLPTTYGISAIGTPGDLDPFLAKLEAALAGGLRLMQLREPQWPQGPGATSLHAAMQQVLQRCRTYDARLLINSIHPVTWWSLADGVQLRVADATPLRHRPALANNALVGVSAHDAVQVAHAREIGADFAVLGPVYETPSHPDQPGLGWIGFQQAIRDAGLPVLAIGGQSGATLVEARRHGAHGIAGIRGLI